MVLFVAGASGVVGASGGSRWFSSILKLNISAIVLDLKVSHSGPSPNQILLWDLRGCSVVHACHIFQKIDSFIGWYFEFCEMFDSVLTYLISLCSRIRHFYTEWSDYIGHLFPIDTFLSKISSSVKLYPFRKYFSYKSLNQRISTIILLDWIFLMVKWFLVFRFMWYLRGSVHRQELVGGYCIRGSAFVSSNSDSFSYFIIFEFCIFFVPSLPSSDWDLSSSTRCFWNHQSELQSAFL